MESCQIVLCPCPDRSEARRIARVLVERGLAAAVNIVALDSVYRWQGKVEVADEFLLMIKSHHARYKTIERTILDMHSYRLPGIAVVPVVEGFSPYLDWLRSGGEE